MSIEVVAWALKQNIVSDSGACFVLVGLANHAHPDGKHAFPSIEKLASYTKMTTRNVKRKIKYLLSVGIIRKGNQAIAAAHIEKVDRRPVVYDILMERGDTVSPRGDHRGDICDTTGVTSVRDRGDTVSPETSLNRPIEPSINLCPSDDGPCASDATMDPSNLPPRRAPDGHAVPPGEPSPDDAPFCDQPESAGEKLSLADKLTQEPRSPWRDQEQVARGFDIFWHSGIRKLGKKKSEKKFLALCEKMKRDPVEFGLKLRDDIKARLSSGQFGFDKKHAITYLNQETWRDDIVGEECPHRDIIQAFNETIPAYRARPNESLWVPGSEGYEELENTWRGLKTITVRGKPLFITNEEGIEFFRRAFDYAADSSFLMRSEWFNMEWICKKGNFLSLLQNKYHQLREKPNA